MDVTPRRQTVNCAPADSRRVRRQPCAGKRCRPPRQPSSAGSGQLPPAVRPTTRRRSRNSPNRRSATGPLLSLAHGTHGSRCCGNSAGMSGRGFGTAGLSRSGSQTASPAPTPWSAWPPTPSGWAGFTTSQPACSIRPRTAGPRDSSAAGVWSAPGWPWRPATGPQPSPARGVRLTGRQASVAPPDKGDVVLAAYCASRLDSRVPCRRSDGADRRTWSDPLQWAVAGTHRGRRGPVQPACRMPRTPSSNTRADFTAPP